MFLLGIELSKKNYGNKQNNSVDNLEWYNGKQGYKKPKSVVQLDLDGNVINEFQSVGKASQITGITRDSISRVCNGIRNTAGGYKWKYKKVVKQNKSNSNNFEQK